MVVFVLLSGRDTSLVRIWAMFAFNSAKTPGSRDSARWKELSSSKGSVNPSR
jgi:hypothetical protein